jgi:energy-coupling factor transporter ATP-binding protein EcfA2
MWVEKLTIKNIKCFQSTDISFASQKGANKRYPWITLLGENGVGKSTILQALGLLLAGPEASKELLPRPTGWVRDPSEPGKLSVTLHQEDNDTGVFGEERVRKTFSHTYTITGDKPVKVGSETYTEPALLEVPSSQLSWLRTNAFASRGQGGWFAAGYGAFRRLTRVSQVLIPSLDQPTRASNFLAQFDEDRALSSFERWMVYLDFRQAKDPSDATTRRMRAVGENAITRLLPGKDKVTIAEVTSNGLILFNVNGQRVPTISLPDGFRSVIALSGDLIWRLLQAFPDLDDPTQASGVVLIDELDIHLHPTWQKQIAGWLMEVFPNLQFFVATHSPFIAIGAGKDSLTLHLENSAGDIKITRSPDLSAYDVDRALRSPAFGLDSTFSPQTDEKIRKYHKLMRKKRSLDNQEQAEFKQLELFMKEIKPLGGPSEPGSLESRVDAFLEENLP